jgi:hypothetical protein
MKMILIRSNNQIKHQKKFQNISKSAKLGESKPFFNGDNFCAKGFINQLNLTIATELFKEPPVLTHQK